LNSFGTIDSKYRFIILASKRAKQLLKGAKPKISAKSKNLIRIAQAEVSSGLVEYEVIPAGMEDIPERDERVFVGAQIPDESGDPDLLSGKDLLAGIGDDTEEGEDEEDLEEAGAEDATEDEKED
jgi:DNA-directed RNA polymerase subunit K/omega